MPITRRKLFSLRATVGYAAFAAAWILLSDRVLESFSDPHRLAQFSTLKGLIFIALTATMLWFTLQNVPSDADTHLADSTPTKGAASRLLWGVITPVVALAIQWAFWFTIDPFAWLLFYPAVFVASWLGGWLSGILATVLSSLLAWYFFIQTTLTWSATRPATVITVGTFVAMGVLMSLIIEWLRQSEQRSGNLKFEALVEQSLAGIYILQGDRFSYVNPEFARIHGYDNPAQIINQVPAADLVMAHDRDRMGQMTQAQLSTIGQEIRINVTGLRRDGSAVELEVHGRSLQTATGPAVIGLVLDVTQQRRSEQLLRAVVEGTTDAVFVKDRDGRYLMANRACANILGIPAEQIIGQDDRTLFQAEAGDQIKALDRAIMDGGKPSTHEEQFPLRNGDTRTFLVTKGPMFDANGLVTGLFGISRDISDIMSAQTALRDKQALLDRMSALAKVGGWSLDVATMEGTRTHEAARILDLDPLIPESMRLTDAMRFFVGEHRDRLSQAIQQVIEKGESYALELELISAKGMRKWVRSQGEPIWEDGRVVRVEGAIQDISEVQQARLALQAHQERLEQTVQERTVELETARQEAERLMRIKSEFLANMSHEIRTPLNGVLGLAQIGQREHDASARRLFAQILDSGHLLLGIINDILDFSKIEAGKLNVESLSVNLQALLTRATAQVQERAQAKGIELTVQVSDELPATCLSDPLRLEQILLNLLSNAVKFTTKGHVTVSAFAREGRLVLAVVDTGIGMNAQQLGALFRPFEQADGSTTRQYGGTGLGLSITKRLVELLGGEILAHSQPGLGARFEVVLPLLADQPANHPALPEGPLAVASAPIREPAPGAPGRLEGLRVLAAEDNPVNQIVLREFLTMEGALITMVDTGLAAVDCVTQQGGDAFDIVLMDIQMPLMDGYEATRHIIAIAPHLPVIGQTAHAMSEEHVKCLASGMVDLVVKPIDQAVLVQTILRHVPPPHHAPAR
ncbi:MAG: PAS domain S-box protein [Pseudomonadota bacterium]